MSGFATFSLSLIMNRVPYPSSLSIWIDPFICSKIIFEIQRPRPVPPNFLPNKSSQNLRLYLLVCLTKGLKQSLLVLFTDAYASVDHLNHKRPWIFPFVENIFDEAWFRLLFHNELLFRTDIQGLLWVLRKFVCSFFWTV